MPERWIGVVVASKYATVVDVEVPPAGPLVVQGDFTWNLQSGARPEAYAVMHQWCADYVREHNIRRVVIKASAVSQGGTSLAHLESAELRGVIAAAGGAATEWASKSQMSRTFGKRKVDEYVADNAFWSAEVAGVNLRIGSREAAMVLLAARKKS